MKILIPTAVLLPMVSSTQHVTHAFKTFAAIAVITFVLYWIERIYLRPRL